MPLRQMHKGVQQAEAGQWNNMPKNEVPVNSPSKPCKKQKSLMFNMKGDTKHSKHAPHSKENHQKDHPVSQKIPKKYLKNTKKKTKIYKKYPKNTQKIPKNTQNIHKNTQKNIQKYTKILKKYSINTQKIPKKRQNIHKNTPQKTQKYPPKNTKIPPKKNTKILQKNTKIQKIPPKKTHTKNVSFPPRPLTPCLGHVAGIQLPSLQWSVSKATGSCCFAALEAERFSHGFRVLGF